MGVIHTNYNAAVASSALIQNKRVLGAAMEQLSSGARINSAADDASGLAISTRMTSQVRGLSVAIDNASIAVAMLDTVDSALETKANILQRMRELGLQSLNGTLAYVDRAYLSAEFRQLFLELREVANNVSFNGKSILASDETITFQVGDSTNSTFDFDLKNFSFDEVNSVYYGDFDFSGGSVTVGDSIEVLGGIPFGSNYAPYSWNSYSQDYPDQTLAARQAAATYSGTITLSDAGIVSLMNSGDRSRDTMDTISSYLAGELRKIEGFESAGVWWSDSGGFRWIDPFSSGYRVDLGSINSAVDFSGDVYPFYTLNTFHISYNHVTKSAIEVVDARLNEIMLYRAEVGAAVNALTATIDNISVVRTNAEATRSSILDTDYAISTSILAKSQIINQAGLATLSQANAQPEMILALLRP